MAIVGSCVSTVEKRSVWITTSPEFAALLFTRNTRKGHTGRLASLAAHRWGQYGLVIRHGQHHCSTWATQSRSSRQPLEPCGLAIGTSLGRDAGAISGVDRNDALRSER